MTSDFLRSQIDALLAEAAAALRADDWALVRQRAQQVLALDPENADAAALVLAAQRAQAAAPPAPSVTVVAPTRGRLAPQPTSFANGRYKVVKFLGEGGKKKVYLAHDTQLDRDVAFALIKAEGLDATARERVAREAKSMGRLGSHPNIVSVYDMGEEGGQPYLVLPLLPGGDVEGVIEKAPEHRMPLERAIKIAIDTCNGLQFAHSKGIVHRDLKPGNIWLAEDGRAMIGDFGLAVAVDRSRLTQAGMMIGTPLYMPPEQAMGGEATARSDLYSLGCMLYEMICGRPPFTGDDHVAIIGQHLNTPPVSPRWHRPDCPLGLEALVLRLLEKDAAKRPQSAAEAREAIQSVDVTLTPATTEGESAVAPSAPDPIYRSTFVGRQHELRLLQQAFDAALSGNGRLAMVVGEPGIGKTALCHELATYVSLRGGKALVGHCYEDASLPYLPFVEALRALVDAREPDGLRSDLSGHTPELSRLLPEVSELIQVQPRTTGDPEYDRYRLLDSITEFLRRAASRQPLLIVLEDLHDADRGTLDLLAHVARSLAGTRLLILGTYRDIEVDRAHPLSATLAELRRVSAFQRIPLRGLTADEVQRMINAIALEEVPPSLSAAVHSRTEGNPLFVQEVLRYLVEERVIARQKATWRATSETPPSMHIPEGLREVIGRRLTRLSDDCNRVLAVAAIIGREFSLDVLQKIADVSEEDLLRALAEARNVSVVEEHASIGSEVTYRFAHAFFRQMLYEETIAPRRVRLHQRVAETIEALHTGGADEHAAQLAEHFSHSSDADCLTKAIHYGEAAARRAISVYAYGEAADHLARCVQVQDVLDPNDAVRQCDLLLALAKAQMLAGEPRRVIDDSAHRALRLAENIGDRTLAARICRVALDALHRWGSLPAFGTPEGRHWAEQADRFAVHGTVERIWADVRMGRVRWSDGNYREGAALMKRGLGDARELGDPEALFIAGFANMWQAWGSSDSLAESLKLAQEFTGSTLQDVSVYARLEILWHGGDIFLIHGDRARAEELWQRARDLTDRTMDPYMLLHVPVNAVMTRTLDGHLESAVEEARHLAKRAEELGSQQAGSWWTGRTIQRPLIYLGRVEEALAFAEVVEQPQTYVALLLAHLHKGQEAPETVEAELERLNVGSDAELPLPVLLALLEAATLQKNSGASETLARKVAGAAHLALGDCRSALTTPSRHLGAAAVLLGEPEKARAHYDQALEASRRIGFRPEVALTRLQLAELLLHYYPDERADAVEHLDFAIREFQEMKMQPSLERALRHRELLKA